MTDLTGVYILRRLDANLDSLTPTDKVAIIKQGTNSSGTQDIDVSDQLRNWAVVDYIQLKQATVAAGVFAATAAVPGDVVTNTLFIAEQGDFIMDGGE